MKKPTSENIFIMDQLVKVIMPDRSYRCGHIKSNPFPIKQTAMFVNGKIENSVKIITPVTEVMIQWEDGTYDFVKTTDCNLSDTAWLTSSDKSKTLPELGQATLIKAIDVYLTGYVKRAAAIDRVSTNAVLQQMYRNTVPRLENFIIPPFFLVDIVNKGIFHHFTLDMYSMTNATIEYTVNMLDAIVKNGAILPEIPEQELTTLLRAVLDINIWYPQVEKILSKLYAATVQPFYITEQPVSTALLIHTASTKGIYYRIPKNMIINNPAAFTKAKNALAELLKRKPVSINTAGTTDKELLVSNWDAQLAAADIELTQLFLQAKDCVMSSRLVNVLYELYKVTAPSALTNFSISVLYEVYATSVYDNILRFLIRLDQKAFSQAKNTLLALIAESTHKQLPYPNAETVFYSNVVNRGTAFNEGLGVDPMFSGNLSQRGAGFGAGPGVTQMFYGIGVTGPKQFGAIPDASVPLFNTPLEASIQEMERLLRGWCNNGARDAVEVLVTEILQKSVPQFVYKSVKIDDVLNNLSQGIYFKIPPKQITVTVDYIEGINAVLKSLIAVL